MKEEVKILVVDDEVIMRNLLLKILEQEGYQVTLAGSYNEAITKLNSSKFDLVLSDVKMPETNGFELLKEIKNKWPQTAVIMMTGYGDAYTVKEALMLGADEYVTKPFKSHEISLIIERAYWRLLASRNKAQTPVN
ncbi:MAG: response regulator [candidate division Zixibacteria bacterium]|jgi:DNA-binding NtrC family response regulator|nr:response regulator [candidate division Zixibacteria bacterium]